MHRLERRACKAIRARKSAAPLKPVNGSVNVWLEQTHPRSKGRGSVLGLTSKGGRSISWLIEEPLLVQCLAIQRAVDRAAQLTQPPRRL